MTPAVIGEGPQEELATRHFWRVSSIPFHAIYIIWHFMYNSFLIYFLFFLPNFIARYLFSLHFFMTFFFNLWHFFAVIRFLVTPLLCLVTP